MVLPSVYTKIDDSTSKRKNAHRLHLPSLRVPGSDMKCRRCEKLTPVVLPKLSIPERQNAPKFKNVPGLPTWEYRTATATDTYSEKATYKPERQRLPDIRERPGHSGLRLGPVHKHSVESSSLESRELPEVTTSKLNFYPRYYKKSAKIARPERPSNPTPSAERRRYTAGTPCPEDC